MRYILSALLIIVLIVTTNAADFIMPVGVPVSYGNLKIVKMEHTTNWVVEVRFIGDRNYHLTNQPVGIVSERMICLILPPPIDDATMEAIIGADYEHIEFSVENGNYIPDQNIATNIYNAIKGLIE